MKKKKDYTTIFATIGGAAFGFGAVTGWFAKEYVDKNRPIHGDDILNKMKNLFLEEGPIEGSWIELTKVPLRKFAYKTDVYYGGISRLEQGELVQYEFIADAYTGSIMDVYRV